MDTKRAERFYHAIIAHFSEKYPYLQNEGAKLVLVLHAFEDKIPLVRALLQHGLLAGIVLKKSSSEMQGLIVDQIAAMAREYDIPVLRSKSVYNNTLEWLHKVVANHKFVIGDHGSYFGRFLEKISAHFGARFLGCTEHTINGEARHALGVSRRMRYPYVSTARGKLKYRSDRDIARSIAQSTVDMTLEATGLNLLNPGRDATVLVIGYGTMGMNCADQLKHLKCGAEILVHDSSPMKRAFIRQDGFSLATDIDNALPRSDVVVFATNTVVGMPPVINPSHFGNIKKDACLTSMTSFVDEARKDERVEDGTIRPLGFEGGSRVYETAAGNRFNLLVDGRPTNTILANGGVEESILMVEAAGIAGAFYVVSLAGKKKAFAPTEIPLEDCDTIAALWLEHMHNIPTPSLHIPTPSLLVPPGIGKGTSGGTTLSN